MFLLSTIRLARVQPILCTLLSPFGNELIKHNPREEQDVMHEIKIRVLQKIYKQVFNTSYTIIMPKLAEQE
jgi:hypothetical protein